MRTFQEKSFKKNLKSTSSGERMGGINKDSLPASTTQLQFGAQLNSMADTSKDSYGYILSSREREIQRNTQTVKSNEFGCCLESKTYDKEVRNGSMHNSRKMSRCQCNGNGLNYSKALKKGSGEKLTLQKDGLVENMPQIRELDIGPCPVGAAFASPMESSRKVPSSSFEFYVRSEEGINLYVDLNSSPSDWTKRFKNEVHICENVQSNKCQSLDYVLGCRDGDKELERSFLCDISADQIKDGHVHTRSSSSSKIKIIDHMDLASLDQPEEGDRRLISSAILPCSMQIERGTQDHIDQEDLWTRARMGKDGKYANEKIENLVEKINAPRKKATEGEISSSPPADILTEAVGIKESRDWFRGRGKGATNFFHSLKQSSQKKNESKTSERIRKMERLIFGLLEIIKNKDNVEEINKLISTYKNLTGHADDVIPQEIPSISREVRKCHMLKIIKVVW
ncbi:uncharacterized protein LOC107408963 isoform X2 [Ziziphus jujuba]|uniref:Uncharacterized protein LOC107408963 isoform X2 n=1 Tax=Ziziphus jujuba TaxID=326968 RepID=A0ABM4A599_ZIZJJ|nr:uncharacterized protein LOC107408963 isoform X2 [Ziziphus jujuba]